MPSTKVGLVAVTLALLASTTLQASIEVTYTGSGAADGLAAEATFSLLSANQLQIHLRNTSVIPYGGVDGDAAMVLSSINFDLGGVLITGGSVALGTAKVVKNTGGDWQADASYSGNINSEYGYSNKGVGNYTGSPILSDITANEVNNLLDGAVTSHTNGGKKVTRFDGTVGLPGGLDFGLVALGSEAFGTKRFVLDGVILTLNLGGLGLTSLDFLESGSYVEFGSDYAYVGGQIQTPPPPPGGTVPEASSVVIWSLLAGVGVVALETRKKV